MLFLFLHFDQEKLFAGVADCLPCMQSYAERIVAMRKRDPSLFTLRGGTIDDEFFHAQDDLNLMLKEFMTLMEGRTRLEAFWIYWRQFWQKDVLIQTLESVDQMILRLQERGNLINEVLWSDRMCYYRMCTLLDTHNSATVKLSKFIFLVCLVTRKDVPYHATFFPPASWLHHRRAIRPGDPRRSTLQQYDPDNEVPHGATTPFHPEWFARTIPLFDTPEFHDVVAEMDNSIRENVNALMDRTSFFKMSFSKMRGVLAKRLDLISQTQAKIIGFVITGAVGIIAKMNVIDALSDIQNITSAVLKHLVNQTHT